MGCCCGNSKNDEHLTELNNEETNKTWIAVIRIIENHII